MRLFLDTSVLLAASGSGKGASRFVITEAITHGWELVSSDYCDEETRRNLLKVGRSAATAWKSEIMPRLRFVRASLALDKPWSSPRRKTGPSSSPLWRHYPIGSLSTKATFTQSLAARFTACGSPRRASFCWSSAPRAWSDRLLRC